MKHQKWTVQARKNTKTFNEPRDLSSNEAKKNPNKLEVNCSKHRIPSFNNQPLDRCEKKSNIWLENQRTGTSHRRLDMQSH